MAAPVRGNFTKKQGGGTTAAIATTGGAQSVMLLCISSADGSTPTVSGTDSAGNTAATWNAGLIVNQGDATSGDRIRIFALVGGVGNASHTVPTNAGGADIVFLVEYTGATGVEVYNAAADAGPFTISTSATTTVADSVIFSQGNADTGTTPVTASCSAATVFSQESDFGTYWGSAIADETVNTVGVKTETWSASPAANRYLRGIVAIKGTTDGGSTVGSRFGIRGPKFRKAARRNAGSTETASAVVDTPVNPGVGSLVFTGFAPTIAQPQTSAPGVGNLTLTGFAPSVVQNTSVLPDVGSLTFTGFAPSVAQPQTANPGVGALTFTGFAPTISQPQTAAPGVGSITFTGYAPGIAQGNNVAPGVGSVTFTGYAPAITQPQTSNPSAGSVTFTGFAPSVLQNTPVAPGVASVVFTGFAPSIAQPQTSAPGVGSVVFTGFAPTVAQAGGANAVNPGVGSLALTGYAPTVAQGSSVELLGGGPGGPRKRKGGTESYIERLLGRPLDEYEPEEIESIEEAIEEAVEAAVSAPEMPKPAEVGEQFKQYAFVDAYVDIYLRMVAEMRQQKEEEQIVTTLVMLL